MAPIIINGNLVDLDSGHPKNATFSADAPKESEYILIQTKRALSKAELAQVTNLGAVLQESVAQNTYLFRHTGSDLAPIRELTFVDKAGVYQKGLKANHSLQSSARIDPTAEKDVFVVLHADKGESPEQAAEKLAAQIDLDMSKVSVNGNRVKMRIRLDQMKALSQIDSVRTIEEVPNRVLTNDLARKIMNADIIINDTNYRGAGQVVAVADTGLDKGNTNDMHPAFKGRVKALIPVGRASGTNDTIGHGTHVSGSILGVKVESSTIPNVEGIAPEAELVFQSLLNDEEGLFPIPKDNTDTFNLKDMFAKPYKDYGATIHSNSWGGEWSDQQMPYGEESRQIDEVMWENPELLIVFAAGNDGAKWPFPTVGAHAAAKNCLTVGATESLRPSVNGAYRPLKKSVNDTTEISWYSSRGPTKEGRIKPDVVAPGTAIMSAKSRDVAKMDSFGKTNDPLWSYCTGTSMATPLVSGCVAVLREALVKNGVTKPSAVLLKALIINGAFAFHHAHSAKEGFGRVNLENSIIIPGQTPDAGFETGKPLKDRDEVHTITVQIPEAQPTATAPVANGTPSQLKAALKVGPPAGPGITLKVTMAYTDMPSATIQNDINLKVVSSDGIQRNGNMGSYSKEFDFHNNVQQVIWKGIPPGKAEISVVAGQILSDSQDYALIWRIIHTEE